MRVPRARRKAAGHETRHTHATGRTPRAPRYLRPGIELAAPVRYTGRPLARTGAGRPVPQLHTFGDAQNALRIMGLSMSATFETVANIISETCDIPRDKI